ncbi:oxidoreductase [Microbacterium sp. Root61]|uniref:Gfo/Idh/MocA family protein n=1 Tax=Microbacterium sp. Root61 TaxID=1736570 RepID=UPI0006F40FBE|nr:Gfo/Idh/MocA family oxidoreductase [Microbacterium sp. Root61]KRA24269.1 oxidoreductase [Microbacterium sp. Root61]
MTMDVADTEVGTLRAGFLGAGFMAQVHSRASRAAGALLQSVASSRVTSAQEAARTLRIDRAEQDTADLLAADDIDVVHVCTPNATHAGYAAAAVAAGKHVICEKPLATTVDDARLLVEAAQVHGVVGAVPFVYRYHPIVREARARIASGEVGTLLTLDCSYLQDWLLEAGDENWRVDAAQGGASRAFADIGSHLVDLIEFVTGDRVARLSARTRTVFPRRAGNAVANEDIAALVVELAGGALGTILVSQMAPGRKNALVLELHGTAESLRFAQERPEELWIGRREGSQLILRDPIAASPDSARLSLVPAGHPMGYQDAFNAFVSDAYAAMSGDTPDGLPTFDDGLRSVILTAAVLESAATGQWVEVHS